jgi:acyl dehydratase
MKPGDELPEHDVLLTRQLLVMAVAATRDFTPIHYDDEAARATGADAAYANTIFLESLLEACVRKWAGARARIAELDFRMLAFNLVGDRLRARGVVREVDGRDARVELWIESARGTTVRGNATVRFEEESDG